MHFCLSEEVLHFVPKVFDGVNVRTLCGQFVNNMTVCDLFRESKKRRKFGSIILKDSSI